MANGAASGAWIEHTRYVTGYVAFDSATPAYTHSVTTSFTVFNPTFVFGANNGFTATTSPNARITYAGAETVHGSLAFTISFKNTGGTDKDIEFAVYKNGVIATGAHGLGTADTGWHQISLNDTIELATNDYLEVFVKGSAGFTMNVAHAALSILGVNN